jgi:topoisomerase-4 subunit A
MVEIMGWKAVGAKLTDFSKSVEMEWEKKEESDSPQTELF